VATPTKIKQAERTFNGLAINRRQRVAVKSIKSINPRCELVKSEEPMLAYKTIRSDLHTKEFNQFRNEVAANSQVSRFSVLSKMNWKRTKDREGGRNDKQWKD
jgi:hypothetical protein